MMKLMQFPNDCNAVLRFDDVEIVMSATFIYQLGLHLSTAQITGPYARDLIEFQKAIIELYPKMADKCARSTSEEMEICRKRWQQKGVGYWSSWMPEPCPW